MAKIKASLTNKQQNFSKGLLGAVVENAHVNLVLLCWYNVTAFQCSVQGYLILQKSCKTFFPYYVASHFQPSINLVYRWIDTSDRGE